MTFGTPRSFLADGTGNAVYLLATKAGIPLAETQADLTPLQREVLTLGMVQEREEQDAAMDGGPTGPTGSGMPVKNSMAPSGGGGDGSTRTFVNVSSESNEQEK